MRFAFVLCVLGALSACETVQPWEKGTLSKKEMAWEPDVMEANLRGQIHASKEASSGGTGAAGGGCGCN
ncbi:MAG: DUF4266 domain-containing protein [Halioglobus sp.]